MAPDTDCMGNPTKSYWRQFLKCSDGEVVIGFGDTAAKATEQANQSREHYEGVLRLPPRDRLKLLAGKDLCDKEAKEAIQLLIQLALQYPI